MNRFILDGRYGDLLGFYGISVEVALRKAGFPGDVFSHKSPAMNEKEYFKFMEAVRSFRFIFHWIWEYMKDSL